MKSFALILVLVAASALFAQPPGSRHVTFSERWPTRDPQFFEMVIQSDGTTKYRSLPLPDHNSDASDAPEPYEFTFTLSPQSRDLVFSVAPRLREFQGSLDKQKVAYTGTKTFEYDSGSGSPASISYNFSSSRDLTALTNLLQSVSATIELSQSLQSQLRFDKLAIDASLRRAQELAASGDLAEIQLLHPVLTRIANDPTVLNIARQRARRILQIPVPELPDTKLK